jgi:hypothetical protein
MNIQKMSEDFRIPVQLLALELYFRESMKDDRIWCGCGDEIIHEWPYSEPVYYDNQGQYCCWICGETTYEHINRHKDQ